LLGHGHFDHAGGAYQFDRALLDPADYEICRRHTSQQFRGGNHDLNRVLASLTPRQRVDFLNGGTGHLMPLLAGRVFDLGGVKLRVLAMPGHTYGSVGLLEEERRVLLDSDSANGNTWMFLEESTPIYIYLAMLRRVASLGFDTLCTAHDRDPLPASVFQKYIAAAETVSPEAARPYETFFNLLSYIYDHDGVSLSFSARTLEG